MLKKATMVIYILVFLVPWGCFSGYATTDGQNYDAAKTLQNLINYEIDSSFLLNQCFDNLKSKNIKENIAKMKEECEENIKTLSSLIQKYGGEVPSYEKDFKGFLMEGYAAMRGSLTDQGALKALHTNQKFILKAFESALDSRLPEDAKGKINEIVERKKENIKRIEKQIG